MICLAHSLYQEGLPARGLWGKLLGRKISLVLDEDNQATILGARKGYSPKLRGITRTHKVNLECLAEQLEPGNGVRLEYVKTESQAADIFTKALAPQKWDHALKLLGIRTDLPEVLVDVRGSEKTSYSRFKGFVVLLSVQRIARS